MFLRPRVWMETVGWCKLCGGNCERVDKKDFLFLRVVLHLTKVIRIPRVKSMVDAVVIGCGNWGIGFRGL